MNKSGGGLESPLKPQIVSFDSPVARLPIARWAARFRNGSLELVGRCESSFTVCIGSMLVQVAAGSVCLRADFVGGSSPRLKSMDLIAPRLSCPEGELGEQLHLEGHLIAWLGGTVRNLDRIDLESILSESLSGLYDLQVVLHARAEAAWQVRLTGGLGVDIREGATVCLSCKTRGDAARMTLASPVQVRCEEVAVQLGGGQLRALSRLANVRLTGATVQPDGAVQLQGGSRKGLNRALQGGLQQVSKGITHIVRQSPRFREFLAVAG